MIKNGLFVLILLVACTPNRNEVLSLKRTNEVKYASAFHFEKNDSIEYLVIDEPWPNAIEKKKYVLGKAYERIVCTSTSHLPYFEMLGMEESVIGFPSLKYISSETFIDRANQGLLTDLGPDGGMNMELLIGLNPDAVVAFDMGGESTTLDKIEESNIPVIYNSDFLEQSPLGRAEWIKFFGALLNKRKEADSIFRVIEKEYLRLENLGSGVPSKPTILSGVVYGDTWFLPGGNNWAATFFTNAGGEYLWENDTTSGWLELSFEAVYDKGNNADFWIGTSTINTKNELLGQDARYADFNPFNSNQVYNYSKRIGPNGGYDFFESGYSRPDLVLADLIKILHPDLLPEYETYYFQKLE
jgi:iron complex transport system substrate-binding protein